MAAKILTAEEKEIREAERKAMAEVRRWKRNVSKRLMNMTAEEMAEHYRKRREKRLREDSLTSPVESGLSAPVEAIGHGR